MMNSIWQFSWKDEKENRDRAQQFSPAATDTENFFDQIRNDGKNKIDFNGVKLSYRRGQHRFARDVMTAIRDNQILLVQAGVGIGKSMGYLIPILHSFNRANDFNNVVISTSNIALQQQLLTDINFISNLLGIKVNAVIAKGINNYACLKRIEELLVVSNAKDKKLLLELRNEMQTKETVDRDEIKEVSDTVWQQIQMKSRGACSNCRYSKNCLYRKISQQLSKADIIVTNHGNFVKSVKEASDFFLNADMFVFDEAHKLEDSIRSMNANTLELMMISDAINYYINQGLLKNSQSVKNALELIRNTDKLFTNIKEKVSYSLDNNYPKDQNVENTDYDKIPFISDYYDKEFMEFIHSIMKGLDRLIKDIDSARNREGYYYHEGYYYNDLMKKKLKEFLLVFKDIVKRDKSENIYWINYDQKNPIHIGYVSKSNINITQSIFSRGIPIVCTSGTLLDANRSYNYFKKGLAFDKIRFANQTIVDGRAYESPYNYDRNSIFYYDTTIANPKNYQDYVQELIVKVEKLIRATNGRSLVLFTSKSTMEVVYRVLKQHEFDFELMMQGEASNSQLCRNFEKNVKSCLFATGSFWEGIDIAGKALCNVIITRLPFANVDAIMEYKTSEYSKKDAFEMVYINDMMRKLTQGVGRLIRSSRDKGVVCCLDSRIKNYIDIIRDCTPYTQFTTEIQDVFDFSERYITNRDNPHRVKKI